MGHVFLVLIDSYSKWMDVKFITSRTKRTIMYDFLVHGLSRKVVTDNSHTFSSEEFQQLMGENGIFSTP